MSIPPPISEETRARIVELAADGMSRNAIAVEVGVAPRTVTKYATAAGHTFDRGATKAATEAARIDNAAKREALAADILTEVAASVRRLKNTPEPANARESEQRARALAAVSRAFGDTTRAAPIIAGDPTEVLRDGMRDFMGTVTQLAQLRRVLAAYESMYGPLPDIAELHAPDNYGREGLDDTGLDDER